MATVEADWAALAKAVMHRRVELGHESRETFAESAQIALRTVGDVERGKRTSYRPSLLARLERALQWPPGTVDAILQGLPAPEQRSPRTPNALGFFLLSAIRDAGFTSVKQAADAAQLNPATVSHLIYGTRDVDRKVLPRLAEVLGVPVEELLARLDPGFNDLPGRPLHPLAVEASDMLDPGSPLTDADRDFLVRMLDLLLERMRLKMATRRDG